MFVVLENMTRPELMEKKTGTNTAVNELKKYDRTVVKKHYPNKDGNRFEMNTYDAEQLFVRVSQFILLNS